MARHLSEMLLIVRAQNQASGALRRVGKDLQGLNRMDKVRIQQQKLLLNQQNLMRQRQRALRELQSITQGTRAIDMQRRAMAIEKGRNVLAQRRNRMMSDWGNISNQIARGQARLQKITNDQYRRETQQIRLLARQKRAQLAEESAVKGRQAMLKSRGGLKGVPDAINKASLASIAAMRNRLALLDRMLVSNADRQRELARSTIDTTRGIHSQIRAGKLLGESYAATGAVAADLDARTRKLSAAHREAAMRANEVRSQLQAVASRYAIVNKQQAALGKEMRRMRWEPISRAGSAIQHMGRVGQYAFLVFGGALGYAAHQSAVFEKQVTLAATQTAKVGQGAQAIARNTQKLMPGILAQMMKFPATSAEMSQSAYEIFSSLDISLKDGMGLLKNFNKASVAGQVSLQDATKGALTVLNDFRVKGQPIIKNSTDLLNTMFAGVQFGRITFAELSDSMSQLVPAFKSANQPFDEMIGSFAFLTRHMPAVGMARTALARLTEAFANKDFRAGVKKFGVNIEDAMGRMKPMSVIVDSLIKRFPKLARAAKTQKGDLSLQNFFKEMTAAGSGKKGTTGTIQMRRALQNMIIYHDSYKKVLAQVKGTDNAFDRSLAAMQKTTGVRWDVFLNQMRALALMIGAAVIPELLKLAPHVSKIVDYLKNMNPELRKSIVHWAAITVAVVGVASALAFVLGPMIRLIALLAKGRVLWIGVTAGFIAASAAIALLHGDWNGLNSIINSFFSLTDHGTWGWIAMFALASAGAMKLAKSIVAVRTAWMLSQGGAAVAGAGGLAGLFARGRRGANDIKGMKAIASESGRIKALLTGAGIAAASIPVVGWAAAAAIAAAAGGALLWKRHMDAVKKAAQEIKNITLTIKAPQVAAQRFGGTANSILDFKQAEVTLAQARRQVTVLQAAIKAASGSARIDLELQLNQALIDRAHAAQSLTTAYNNLRVGAGAFTDYLARQRIALATLGAQQVRLNGLLDRRKQLEASTAAPGARADAIRIASLRAVNAQIDQARANIKRWAVEVNTGNAAANASFSRIVTTMQRLNMLPKGITANMRNMAMDFQRQIGRLMTPSQLQKFFKIALNLDMAPANNKMAEFQRKWQAKQIKMSADIKIKTGRVGALTPAEILSQGRGPLKRGSIEIPATIKHIKLPRNIFGGLKIPPIIPKGKPGPAKRTIENAFKKPIVQQIRVSIPAMGTLAQLGANITAGVAAGVAGSDAISSALMQKVIAARAAAGKAAGEGSPAKLFIPLGTSMIDGIIKGLLNKDKIERAASLTMQLFSGAFLQHREELIGQNTKFDPLKLEKLEQQALDARARFKKKHRDIDLIRAREYEKKAADMRKHAQKLSIKDLIKDTAAQAKQFRDFNNALKKLSSRVPAQMLEDLRALGIDGLKYIQILANGTPKQIAAVVRNWKKMQKEIKRSQSTTVQGTKEFTQSMKDQLKELTDTAANKLLDTWNQFKDQNTTNFGALFEGPLNLADKAGQSFKDAHDTWKQNLDDLNAQIKDLTDNALAQRVDELQSAFGALFSGDWLTGATMQTRIDWGIAPTFDDLFKDLDAQVTRFNTWRETLTALGARVPPELAAQLEALGPDAIATLQALNSGTDAQLAAYIALWQQAQGTIAGVAGSTFQTTDYLKQLQTLRDQIAALQEPMALTGTDIINDLQGQMDKWKEYEGVLTALKDRGVPLELIAQLRNLGPEALPYLQTLNTMTQTQLISGKDSFVNKWTTAQGMINTSTNTMMNEQLKMWYSHGANIASALIAGVASEQQALLTFFSSLFKNLLQGKLPTMGGTNTGFGGSGYGYVGSGYDTSQQGSPTSYSTNTASNVTMNVNAHQDEELMTTMERALFRLRNRSE